MKTLLVTGGAGFIGSALVRYLIEGTPHRVVVLDKLSYAGHLASLEPVAKNPRLHFERLDLVEKDAVRGVLERYEPDAVLHLAAETHVDRSIDDPSSFIHSNILGTFSLLEALRAYWRGLEAEDKRDFRFLHVSTDEVFGSLGPQGRFSESSRYDPRSPYAASKAAADHLASAWRHTYGLPVLVTNCSNNYGPYQYPEKLVPVAISKALAGETIPVYGDGGAVRDWLYVEDHVRGLATVLERGSVGESYNVGANEERTTTQMVRAVCELLDELRPRPEGSYLELLAFVRDRPGHDRRYAVDASKLRSELGWRPQETLETGLRKTVRWYLDNERWRRTVLQGARGLERSGRP